MRVVEHPVKIVEVVMKHDEVQGALEVESCHHAQKSGQCVGYLLCIN
jgi:hypothetical protein